MQVFTPKCFCFLKDIDSILILCECIVQVLFCFVLIACFIWEHAFNLPGVGLCLCFKLKRLMTSDLWTSTWPTWVQVGSLIITSPPTFMTYIHGYSGASLSPVCWCAWQAMSAAEERNPVYCNKKLLFCIWSLLFQCFLENKQNEHSLSEYLYRFIVNSWINSLICFLEAFCVCKLLVPWQNVHSSLEGNIPLALQRHSNALMFF